ncbi:MAG: glycosyltransferase family 4 protein [Paludibacteraceae bacterium]|nr:glycosyltransferase family 4 protein [Paludibacteraceae bacterium]
MKIAYDAKRAFANRRGLGNYSRDVIRLMLHYAPQNEYLLFGKPSPLCPAGDAQVVQPQGVWQYCPSLWRSFGCLNEMDGIDIYHGLSGELPFGIHRLPLKTVVTMHDAIFMRYPELYSAGYRRMFARKVQYACDHADLIIAISEQTKQDMMTYFHADESKIRVVYQGCNNRFREPVTEEKLARVKEQYSLPEHYVLTVGAIEPRKNLSGLIEAMSAAHIDLPLVAVGSQNTYAAQLAQLARTKGVDLRYLHSLPFEDLPAVYKLAEVFCYPSLFEGFGIPILESMCIGTPVVTSTGSCFAETGGEAALYADPLQPVQIGEQLTRVLTDKSLRNRMIAQGHLQADTFADERVAANLISVYNTLKE